MELQKLKPLESLAEIVKDLKAQGQRVVFANGCFDILHGGHVSYLESARAAGDVLIVAVNSDTSIQALKGPDRPVLPQADRLAILDAIRHVDYLIVFDEPTVMGLLETLRPHIHAKGTDYTLDSIPERDTTRALGIEVMIAGAPKQNASRDIIARIRDTPES